MQGRFPIRVELASLSIEDFKAILTSTHASLIKQYQALLATEGLGLSFTPEAIDALARIAHEVNERTENIGARRLATVLERLLEEASFDAPNRDGQQLAVDAALVNGARRRANRAKTSASAADGFSRAKTSYPTWKYSDLRAVR